MKNRSSPLDNNEGAGSSEEAELPSNNLSGVPTKPPNMGGWIVFRFAISAILFFAAFMKARQLVALPSLGDGWLDSRFVNICAVVFESVLALWLVVGFKPKATRIVVILLFALFTCISLFKALSGARSCGCFGELVVNPWLTSLLDLTVVVLSIVYRPSSERVGSQSSLLRVGTFCFLVAIVSFFFLMRSMPQKFILLQSIDQKLTSGTTIVLEPDTWVGQVCPLLSFCNLQEDLSKGCWLVMLYRPGCENCHEAFPEYKNRADDVGIPLAVLNVEPDKPDELFEGALCGRLDSKFTWFVETPCLLEINEQLISIIKKEQGER